MVTYLLDTGAWIEFFQGSPKGKKVKQLLEGNTTITAESTIAELLSHTIKNGKDFNRMLHIIRRHSSLYEIYLNIWVEAAGVKESRRKTHPKFGILDSILVAIQKIEHVTIITTDRDFSGMQDVILL